MQNYLNNLFKLNDKVIIITGGTGLLGKECVRAFLECGSKVVFTGRNKEKIDNFIQKLDTQFADCILGLQSDVSKKEDVKEMVSRTKEKFGKIDILINNAGMPGNVSSETIAPLFEDYPEEEWNKLWDINVTGMFLCAQEVGKEMAKAGGGVIVNVSSIYGMVGPDQRIYGKIGEDKFVKPVSYSVTKGAVLNFTRYLATYWGDKNIRINTLVPGGIFNNQDAEFVKKYEYKTPLGRMANTDDIVGPMLFLISDASKYMTGEALVVDGGWLAW